MKTHNAASDNDLHCLRTMGYITIWVKKGTHTDRFENGLILLKRIGKIYLA